MGSPFVIEVKDFQSLKNVKIELVDGINVITGKTNEGKSAVIRAVDSALFNLGDDSMVRGGQRYAAVSIKNDRHKMVFCRDSNGKNEKTAYQFDDGDVQKKVGRSQLPEVAKMFNIRDVRMQNNTKMKLNFWYQNDKPFLMDKTSGQLYEFLSLSSCDNYSKILKTMIVDMKVQEADIANVTGEIDTRKVINNNKRKFVESNDGYDDLYERIIIASQEDTKIQSIKSILMRMQNSISKIKDGSSRLESLQKVLDSIPMDTIETSYQTLLNSSNKADILDSDIKKIDATKTRLDSKVLACGKISDSVVCADKVNTNLEGKVIQINFDEGDCIRVSGLIRDCESKKALLNTAITKLDKIGSRYEDVDSNEIEKKINSLGEEKKSLDGISTKLELIAGQGKVIESKESKMSELNGSLAIRITDMEELKKSAGYCPFCGTVFGEK